MSDSRERIQALRAAMQERILVLDGAMGTAIQGFDLGPRTSAATDLEGCNEHLVLTRPDAIRRDPRVGYLDAGADIIETNTFGGTRIVLAEYGLADKVYEINCAAARLAREAADGSSTQRPAALRRRLDGARDEDDLGHRRHHLRRGAGGFRGADGGAGRGRRRRPLSRDAAGHAQREGVAARHRRRLRQRSAAPCRSFCRCRSRRWARCSPGRRSTRSTSSVAHRDLLAIGLNCATGPDFMTDHLRTLAEISRFPISCFPNAGLPDEEGNYNELPAMLAAKIERFCAEGWVNIVGGCCGTTRRAHPARSPRSRASTAAAGRPAGRARGLGHRDAGDRRGHPAGHRRRAHQRARQPQVQAADRRGQDRRGGRDRPRAGAARRPRRRRLPAGSRPRRARRRRRLPRGRRSRRSRCRS